ncbi:hypothetical protein C8R46DRAFT_472576 [Mycena filopes]|nr:hypothetical protein C8R46DRAFT_472576 [Mycena filopes]
MPPGEDFRNVPFEIASLPELRFHCDVDWFVLGEVGNLMGNGWTRMRYDANAPFNKEITLLVKAPRAHLAECWVPQANYIFSTQHIESNWEDYVLVDKVDFAVMIAEPTVDCPAGYLFLCPQEHFQVGISSLKWPDNPAYWSLDPLGVERLGGEEATQLGFPPFQLITRVQGCFWDASVYAGLRQFHRAKGFDPESQNVARHLGLPLYQLSRNIDPPFAHIGEHDRENKHWEDTEEDEDYWQLNMFSGDGPQPQSPLPGNARSTE